MRSFGFVPSQLRRMNTCKVLFRKWVFTLIMIMILSKAEVVFVSLFKMVMTKDGENWTDVSAYGAYMDTRAGEANIRILINSHDYLGDEKKKPRFCQLWFPGIAHPLLSQVSDS